MAKTDYNWKYVSLGGVVRVQIASGEDIAHLGELDQKKWTVLSCPTSGLEFDSKTLAMLDTDCDGRVQVAEVVAAAEYITSLVKDKDSILNGEDSIALDNIDTSTPKGQELYDSAKRILAFLGKENETSISVADTSDSVAIFSGTRFNGDGIITEASADDEAQKETIAAAIATVGSVTDRSGAPGVDEALIEKFYAALADYDAWIKESETRKAEIFPSGEGTAAALASVDAVKGKVADYFMRCKLIKFDADALSALDVSVDKIGQIGGGDLTAEGEQIASYPLARPTADGILHLDALNPAWEASFAALRGTVIDEKLTTLTETEWQAVLDKFAPYLGWCAAKKGGEVESLGIEKVRALLKAGLKDQLMELVARDKTHEKEAAGIDEVDRLTHYYRDFYRLLCNYVTFSDFYSRDGEPKAVFEAGKLYIDERCCNFCVKVDDMGKHGDMAGLSNMFLIYCHCINRASGKEMDIAAEMTAGSISDLRPGKNCLFYDRNGESWDAVVTKIVDNPVSIRQAFWSPYRKLAKYISEKIDKSAAEKDAAAVESLKSKADEGVPAEKPQPFDIGKFAGIFAAIGMAVGALGVALSALFKGIFALEWWQLILTILGIMLVISGPACFIAWRKLRRRNLGPVLNANGWAVNSKVLVNILFGATLTTVAKYPVIKGGDPFVKKTPLWKKVVRWVICLLIVAFGVLFFTDNLKCIGLPFHKEAASVEEVVPAAGAPAADVAVPEAPAE